MNIEKNRILITGSTGCIGTHAVHTLLNEGVGDVFGFNRSEPANEFSENYHFIQGDLSDPTSIERAVNEVQPTHVIHLGALQTPDCRDFPIKGLEVNVLGTAYLFRACQRLSNPLERFVFASSSAVNGNRSLYGESGVRPEDPYHPFNLYGYWKVSGEGMAQAFHQACGTPTVSLRLATTYGPGRDRGFTAAMTSAIKSLVNGESFLIPYRGKEHYHFSLDVGAGFARAAIDPFDGYGVFNLLGETSSIDNFIELIQKESLSLGMKSQNISYAEGAKNSPFIYDLNDEATKETFPKMPKTSLSEGIHQSLKYFRENT
ncbi:MAG: NAD-dependent dehydratase [Opitutae bacterium]|nr:NAD-dependent dehydratase [Opitutae bacterium]|tara:strand:- start:709 stop:1659 length:951 start_codon:yes stop_codon:yes gene_type:complete